MAFWDNVNSGLKKAVDEGWTAVRDSAKIGKSRYRLHTLHKQAETLFAEIGGIVYDMADSKDGNPLSRPEVRDLIDDIKRIEAQSADIEGEIEQTREKDKTDDDGGAVEGAWPAAVSKEAYDEEEGDEDGDEAGVTESAVSEDEVSEEDDSLGAAGGAEPDDSGDGDGDEASEENGAGADSKE
ncbi:MAG: hypothetical protein IME99_03745 [Proteobacteria bacterium]|nr:hypothetical protein [Pseudomonadota bacterium]